MEAEDFMPSADIEGRDASLGWLEWAAKMRAELDRHESTRRVMVACWSSYSPWIRTAFQGDFDRNLSPEFVALIEFLQRRVEYIEARVRAAGHLPWRARAA